MALEGLLGLIMRADAVPGPTQDDPDRGKGPMGGGALRHLPTLSSLMLAGDPGRSSFGELNQAPEARVRFPPLPPNGVWGFDFGGDYFSEGKEGETQALEGQEKELIETEELSGQTWRDSMQRTWSSVKGWMSPNKQKREAPSPAPKRKELPKLKEDKKIKNKDKLLVALGAARTLKRRGLKNPSIEKSFAAASAVHSKNAKKRTVRRILEVLAGEGQDLPLTQETLKGLASALQQGGYKAGEGYLVEAKLWHIESGHSWSDALDRAFKQCKRALSRGQGPRKRAKEVARAERLAPAKLSFARTSKSVKFGAELFRLCTTWMLREIELGLLDTGDFMMDHINKKVTMHLKLSKMDQAGAGVRRTLQCLCSGNSCDEECPYHVTKDLVGKIEKYNGTGSPLAITKARETATKSQIVKSWRWLFGQEVTGHSGRRSGALTYIRAGWTVSQVAHLGRWKSNAILAYAEEALEDMPANLHVACPSLDNKGNQIIESKMLSEEEVENWKTQLRVEMEELKADVQKKGVECSSKVDTWAKFYKENPGTLPKKIQNTSGKVVHANLTRSTSSPPITWRTACGWAYYGSQFVFVEPEAEVTCQKCLQLCAKMQ